MTRNAKSLKRNNEACKGILIARSLFLCASDGEFKTVDGGWRCFADQSGRVTSGTVKPWRFKPSPAKTSGRP